MAFVDSNNHDEYKCCCRTNCRENNKKQRVDVVCEKSIRRDKEQKINRASDFVSFVIICPFVEFEDQRTEKGV